MMMIHIGFDIGKYHKQLHLHFTREGDHLRWASENICTYQLLVKNYLFTHREEEKEIYLSTDRLLYI